MSGEMTTRTFVPFFERYERIDRIGFFLETMAVRNLRKGDVQKVENILYV